MTVSRRYKRFRRPTVREKLLSGTAVVSTIVVSISGFMDERVVHTLGFIILDSLLSELGTLEQLRVDAQLLTFGSFSVAEEFLRA